MALDKLLKRHFWAVILALVALAAFFDAQGIMHWSGASLGRRRQAAGAPRRSSRACPPRPARRARTRRAPTPILARNPFDSVTGPLNVVPRRRGDRVEARRRST